MSGVDNNNTILFSSVGYQPVEIKVNDKTLINVSMAASVGNLDEIVIIAYGSTTNRLNTGNISKVSSTEISKQPINNTLQALQGRIPGLNIMQQTAVPGGSFTVQIRGRNSISNGNEPLYLIDGVPFTSTSLNTNISFSITKGGNPLSSLNPGDIESIEVLKDADATAIYGSRGANGVIMITTKKGKHGKTSLDIKAYSGFGKVGHFMKLLDTRQYLDMRYEAFQNDGEIPEDRHYDLTKWDTTRFTDWQKVLIGGTARYTDIQASVSGGNQNVQFMVGAAYRKETTVFPEDFAYKKGSARFNLNYISTNKKVTGNFTTLYALDHNNMYSYNIISYLSALIPVAPEIYDSNGQLNWEDGTFRNPIAEFLRTYKANTRNIVSNGFVQYDAFKNLSIKANLGYTNMFVDEIQANPLRGFNPFVGYTSANTYTDFADSRIETWIVEPQLEYRKSADQWQVSVLIGATFQNDIRQGKRINATGFSNDALIENLSAAASSRVTNSTISQYRYNAAFGRLNFNLKNKYIFNLTARRDGSSRFAADKQFGNFGAIGGAWLFGDEGFFKHNFKFLSHGKLRSSYGITGNDQLPPYEYLNSWAATFYPYQGSAGLQPIRIGNPEYSWETNKKIEVALELGLYNDRILLNGSYYRNRSSNQLVGYPLSGSTGFLSFQYNFPALVENTGFELQITTTNISKKDLTWKTSVNITIPRNKLVDFPNIEGTGYLYYYEVGRSLTAVKSFHTIGVDPETGVYMFEDIDKDGNPLPTYPSDLTAKKKIDQNFYGGLDNTFRYRGWELDFFFQFCKQTGFNYINDFNPPGTESNQPLVVLDRWRKPGDISLSQRFTQNFGSNAAVAYFDNRFNGDGKISDASFIRLKNLSISYQFPNILFKKKTGLNNFRIYIEAQNLFTITDYIGLDPEVQGLAQPPLRTIVAGIQFTL